MKQRIYNFGAGKQPPVLAGRDAVVADWHDQLDNADANGRAATDDLLFTGPRGIGKTVTVNHLAAESLRRGYYVIPSLQRIAWTTR